MLNTSFKKYFTKNLCNVLQTGIRYHCKAPAIVMNNGNEMPIVGLGTWSSTSDFLLLENVGHKVVKKEHDSEFVKRNSEKVAKAVDFSIDAGYRHIDCAHLYKNQVEIGQVLKKKMENKVMSREELFVTSKLWNTFHDPENVCSACQQTLEDLDLGYLDMYLMHTPMGFQHSNDLFPMSESKLLLSNVDYVETWRAMEELDCKIVPQTLQIEVHPYMLQKKLINFAKCNDICITAYAPVGSPDRPWAEELEERTLLTDYKILQLAEKHGRSPAQILLRFQIQCGHAVVPKATEKEHMLENINIFDFELSLEDVKNIKSLNHNVRYFQFTGASGHPHHPFENPKEADI